MWTALVTRGVVLDGVGVGLVAADVTAVLADVGATGGGADDDEPCLSLCTSEQALRVRAPVSAVTRTTDARRSEARGDRRTAPVYVDQAARAVAVGRAGLFLADSELR